MGLDEYDVIRELGRGGMAVVHLARQRDLQRLVALKELSGFNARDPAFAERFLRESRMAGGLNHPNIVTVYEYFEDGGVPYIAMELVEGGSLRPLIGELSLPKVARVLEDLLAAVGYAGRNGIVHRDLKHENALITKEGRVKVADFGIAKAAASGQAGLTSEGMTVGTPEYMSPEQALARDVGPASDLYSVGCMTYEMLTGRLPFSSDSQAALLVAHVNETVPDVREVDPHIPESVALWVTRMTEKDPDDRFPDAGSAWNAFEEAVLEFIGPLWRRDATLEPATAIDLSDIPAQTATPLRQGKPSPSADPIIATTGYQTYQAPAALHEVLGTDEPAPTVTPPPTPAARPRPRNVTPPPMPATSGQPSVRERTTTPAATEEDERELPIGAIAGVAIVALIIAFVIGMSSGGSSAPAATTGDGFELSTPSGWKAAKIALVPEVGPKPVSIAPPGGAANDGIVAGRNTIAQASLLARGSGAKHVELGAGEAVHVTTQSTSIYVLPTDSDAVIVRCTTAPAVASQCDSVAGSLKLTRGKAAAPGPTDAGAGALGAALTALASAIRNPQEDLGRAKTARAQATAATDLSRAYRTASTAVTAASVGALVTGARDQLAKSLKAVGTGWSRYAGAARAGSEAAVSAARSAVARGRLTLGRARTALSAAGYQVGGG